MSLREWRQEKSLYMDSTDTLLSDIFEQQFIETMDAEMKTMDSELFTVMLLFLCMEFWTKWQW